MDNVQKISFVNQQHNFVRTKVQDGIQNTPRAVPCHVSKILPNDFVEVTIDATGPWTLPKVQIPQAFSKYSREPTQVGDKGYIVPNDYFLGGESGQDGSTASFYQRGNLTTGVFHPISNKNFPVRDHNQFLVTGGPSGHKIQSQDTTTSKVIDAFNNIIHTASQGIIHIAGNLLGALPQIPSGLKGIVNLAGNVLLGGSLPIPTNLQGIIHIAEKGILHIADNALNKIIPSNLQGIVHLAENAISHTSLNGIITQASLNNAINLVSQGTINIGAPSPNYVVQHDLTIPPLPTLPTNVNLLGSMSASINITAGGNISAAGGVSSGGAPVMTEPVPPQLINAPQTVIGSRGGNIALQNLLTSLHTLGLITDNTTP
jgi:hypothetical protein